MKTQYLVLTPADEAALNDSRAGMPVLLSAIEMKRVGRNGWQCNRKDPRIEFPLVVSTMRKLRSGFSVEGFVKIGGKTQACKGSLVKSDKGGTLLVDSKPYFSGP